MPNRTNDNLQLFSETYPRCCGLVPPGTWQQLVAKAGPPGSFPDALVEAAADLHLPGYLGELARVELYVDSLKKTGTASPLYTEKISVNPTLQLFENTWRNLAFLVDGKAEGPAPEKGEERIIVWLHPGTGRLQAKPASGEDLLALKMVLEELSPAEVARQGDIHAAAVQSALLRALDAGIVTGPEPGITRDFSPMDQAGTDPAFRAARIFSLQWHITQACDLHCRHCYDRGQYRTLSLQEEIAILDDFVRFCASRNVHGQVTFTGGNPLLHPDFETLYQSAADRGFTLAVLGNPTSRERIARLNVIQPLAFYQVSLEGLEEHNDYMRGPGHFKKVLAFLDVLRDLGVFSMVMLTLTKDNMDQVLPLAEILRSRADLFTFNRLSLVGEGAGLAPVEPQKYPDFLEAYAAAVGANPCLGIKDNLLNIVYHKQKKTLFGGCTGFGCGAAFNFMAVLPDGTVHACRKFPSPLGSILDQSLDKIYNSDTAQRYRQGAEQCRNCSLKPVCRGCLAVAYSQGQDIFTARDPYCFFEQVGVPGAPSGA